MRRLILLLMIVAAFAGFSDLVYDAFGAATAGSNFCSAFPTHPECTGWRVEPIYDNFWFCQYVDLSTVCNNPPDPQKQIAIRVETNCCGIIGLHPLKNLTLEDESFADAQEKGKTLDDSSSSSPKQELIIWTEKDHYSFGERVNVYGKFDFDDFVLKNNNPTVDVAINDRKVILDLPVHSNGWFAGYFVLSNPSVFYTGSNVMSVKYFHTPTLEESDKFARAFYRVTTGDVIAAEPFSVEMTESSPGKISYQIRSAGSGDDTPVNLDLATVRLTTPEGLVLPLPITSFVDDISDYLDISLVTGTYEITATKGGHIASHTLDYDYDYDYDDAKQ